MQSTPQVDNENDHLSLFLIPECHLMQGAPSGIPTTPHFLSRYFHSPGILCDVELTTPAALTWHRSLGLSIVWMLHLHKSTCLVQIWLQRRCAHPLSKHPLQCLVRHFKARLSKIKLLAFLLTLFPPDSLTNISFWSVQVPCIGPFSTSHSQVLSNIVSSIFNPGTGMSYESYCHPGQGHLYHLSGLLYWSPNWSPCSRISIQVSSPLFTSSLSFFFPLTVIRDLTKLAMTCIFGVKRPSKSSFLFTIAKAHPRPPNHSIYLILS